MQKQQRSLKFQMNPTDKLAQSIDNGLAIAEFIQENRSNISAKSGRIGITKGDINSAPVGEKGDKKKSSESNIGQKRKFASTSKSTEGKSSQNNGPSDDNEGTIHGVRLNESIFIGPGNDHVGYVRDLADPTSREQLEATQDLLNDEGRSFFDTEGKEESEESNEHAGDHVEHDGRDDRSGDNQNAEADNQGPRPESNSSIGLTTQEVLNQVMEETNPVPKRRLRSAGSIQTSRKGKRTPLINAQLEFRNHLLANGLPLDKFNHIPYPSGNKELFRMTDSQLTQKIQLLMKLANSCYSKISPRLVLLKQHVEESLGLFIKTKKKTQTDIYTENSITNLHRKMEGSQWYLPFLFWLSLKTDMRQVIKQNAHYRRRDYTNIVDYDLTKFYIQLNRNLLLIYEKRSNTVHYLTNEMVLMMCDVTEGRLMIDLAMTCDFRYNSFRPRGIALWEIIDSLFQDLGNNTYNIVALIEPLTLAYLQLNDKSPVLKGAFLKYAIDELVDELKNNGIDNDDDIDAVVESFDKIFNLDDIHMVAEFFLIS
uniref:RNA-directed RNA polymerase n=1 Tax=Bat paramyxovirus TaxID=1300978 RepID=A0A5K6W8E7_9MONO|nr:large protein 1 [Bat paramyxovirus]